MGAQFRITKYVLLVPFLFLLSCSTPTPPPPSQTIFYLYRFEPPAFVEFSEDLKINKEIPFSAPLHCALFDVFPAPVGKFLVIELSCPNGQTVLFLDSESGSATQPVTDSDSHFLAWTSDGTSAYLKVDSLGNARVVRAGTDGDQENMSVIGWTYDISAKPGSDDFIFTFSQGMGTGSQLNFTQNNGRSAQTLYADPFHYISFARYSPDGKQIAFIKIPDSPTPFTVGELWVMNADGSDPRKLADVDAGHGYAANWSPDGAKIAFVGRDNPEEETANQSAEALISNLYFVYLEDGMITKVTNFTDGYVETPHWSPGGNTLSFNVVINGRMNVSTVDIVTGQTRSLITDIAPAGGPSCCPAWMRR